MALMSLRDVRRSVGRLAIVGFAGHAVPAELREIAREFDLGGVIYFARNIAEPSQVRDLSRECASLVKEWPLWISVDQEGGRVARLKRPFTAWPPMITLGRCGDDQVTVRFARAMADELRAVGINLDYTPVLDVHTNPKNPVIGDRALSDKAGDVARLGALLIRTLQDAGVAGCGKHFPGHGDTSTDSHFELPLVDQSPDRLNAVELVPFRAAVDAEVACIMTAHVLVPSLDAERPATLSPIVVDGLLKKALGYRGIVISDDLGMKAISASTGLGEAMVLSLLAGCDMALLCNEPPDQQVGALEAVIKAVESGRLPMTRIDDALARQERVKHHFLRSARVGGEVPMARIGCEAHQELAAAMATWV
jgi:beta-N-acetylhexosaminidase